MCMCRSKKIWVLLLVVSFLVIYGGPNDAISSSTPGQGGGVKVGCDPERKPLLGCANGAEPQCINGRWVCSNAPSVVVPPAPTTSPNAQGGSTPGGVVVAPPTTVAPPFNNICKTPACVSYWCCIERAKKDKNVVCPLGFPVGCDNCKEEALKQCKLPPPTCPEECIKLICAPPPKCITAADGQTICEDRAMPLPLKCRDCGKIKCPPHPPENKNCPDILIPEFCMYGKRVCENGEWKCVADCDKCRKFICSHPRCPTSSSGVVCPDQYIPKECNECVGKVKCKIECPPIRPALFCPGGWICENGEWKCKNKKPLCFELCKEYWACLAKQNSNSSGDCKPPEKCNCRKLRLPQLLPPQNE